MPRLRMHPGTLPVLTPGGKLVQPMPADQRERDRRREYDQARASDPNRAIYGTAAWQELRSRLYRLYSGKCQACGILTVLTKAEASASVPQAAFDHIKSTRERPDLVLSDGNVQLLCKPCHDRKTAREQGFNRR